MDASLTEGSLSRYHRACRASGFRDRASAGPCRSTSVRPLPGTRADSRTEASLPDDSYYRWIIMIQSSWCGAQTLRNKNTNVFHQLWLRHSTLLCFLIFNTLNCLCELYYMFGVLNLWSSGSVLKWTSAAGSYVTITGFYSFLCLLWTALFFVFCCRTSCFNLQFLRGDLQESRQVAHEFDDE